MTARDSIYDPHGRCTDPVDYGPYGSPQRYTTMYLKSLEVALQRGLRDNRHRVGEAATISKEIETARLQTVLAELSRRGVHPTNVRF